MGNYNDTLIRYRNNRFKEKLESTSDKYNSYLNTYLPLCVKSRTDD
jgi:hypothetical protein